MNEDVRLMLAHPGRYAVSNAGFRRQHRRYIVVEVDAAGRVYQLTPQGERDGPPLDPDGWFPDTRIYTINKNETVFVRIGGGLDD
jgi:hypothetical protein